MLAFHYETIDSTNDQARRLVEGGEVTSPAFVIADEQTGGKGQRGKGWVSPREAGIYLTVVDFPSMTANQNLTAFTLAAGVGCAEALSEIASVEVHLKPVNDLVAKEGKLAGILTETILSRGSVRALITGVGINVRRADRSAADGGMRPVCLAELIPFDQFAHLDLDRLVAVTISRILTWNRRVTGGEIDEVQSAWRSWALPGSSLPDGRL